MTSFPKIETWREPTQSRSRKRVEALLNAARALMVESGAFDLKMTDIAKRADVPVGSLYQFFPTRTALLARLFELEMQPIDEVLKQGLARVESSEAFLEGIAKTVRAHYQMVRERPCLYVIWASPGADPVIAAADFRNTRANAVSMTDRFLELAPPGTDREAVLAASTLVCHIWGAVTRLCIMVEDEAEAERILVQYAHMIQGYFERF